MVVILFGEIPQVSTNSVIMTSQAAGQRSQAKSELATNVIRPIDIAPVDKSPKLYSGLSLSHLFVQIFFNQQCVTESRMDNLLEGK